MASNDKTVAPIAIRVREAAKMLGISERTLWQWAKDGLIPHRRVGRVVLFSPAELDHFVREAAGCPRSDGGRP